MVSSNRSEPNMSMALVLADMQNFQTHQIECPYEVTPNIYSTPPSSSPNYQSPIGVGSSRGAGAGAAMGGRGGNVDYLNVMPILPMKRSRGRPRKYGPDGTVTIANMRGNGNSNANSNINAIANAFANANAMTEQRSVVVRASQPPRNPMAAFSSSPATTAAHSGAGIGANVLSAIPFAEQLSRMRASQSPPNPLAALSSSSSTAPSVGIGAHAISPISMVMPETSSSKGKAPADSAAGNDNTMTSLAMELLAFHLQNNPQFPDVQTTGGSSDNNNDDDTPYVNLNLGSGIPAPAMAAKRAKGRPRKYGPDGEISIAQMQAAIAHPYGSPSRSRTKSANSSFSAAAAAAGGGSSSVPPSSDVPLTISSTPRVMPSSRNFMSKGTGPALGLGYNPEINTINIKKGEDVFSKIISFSQNTPGSISIVSATGSLSAIALRHPAISDETAIYQGLFGIENMYGTFVPSKFGNFPRKSGGLNITVLGNNGQTIYGQVAGVLIAAAPVKVMIRSFAPNEADNSGVNSGGATGPSNMGGSSFINFI